MKYGGLSLNIFLDELQMTSRPDWNDELIAGTIHEWLYDNGILGG